MADKYLTLRPTELGLNGIVRTVNGDSITFTKICMGNGTPEDPDDVLEMANPLLDISITEIEIDGAKARISGYMTTASVEAGFYAKEVGVYAEGDDSEEYLFGYSYNETEIDYYPDSSSGRVQEQRVQIVVAIGPAQNVTAILVEGDAYASKQDLENHINATGNVHNLTLEDLGLDRELAENKADELTVTYTEPLNLTEITSGEKLSTAFGKIKKAVKSLITHLSATGNVHNMKLSDIGAAPSSHQHSTADITSGILGTARGGTGKASLDDVTVGKAKKLNAARKLKVALGSTADKTFDGSADQTNIPVGGTLPAANGGTGQTSLQAARNAMGLGNTTGALPVANGGTGATDKAGARANLGVLGMVSGKADPTTATCPPGFVYFQYSD